MLFITVGVDDPPVVVVVVVVFVAVGSATLAEPEDGATPTEFPLDVDETLEVQPARALSSASWNEHIYSCLRKLPMV